MASYGVGYDIGRIRSVRSKRRLLFRSVKMPIAYAQGLIVETRHSAELAPRRQMVTQAQRF